MTDDPTPTIFDGILAGEIPADIVYEDNRAMGFRDINPQAPVHVLVIPRRRIRSLAEMDSDDTELIGHLLHVCAEIARAEGIDQSGYRVVTNVGRDGGQSVDHIHFHVLGGRTIGWPPG